MLGSIIAYYGILSYIMVYYGTDRWGRDLVHQLSAEYVVEAVPVQCTK